MRRGWNPAGLGLAGSVAADKLVVYVIYGKLKHIVLNAVSVRFVVASQIAKRIALNEHPRDCAGWHDGGVAGVETVFVALNLLCVNHWLRPAVRVCRDSCKNRIAE